jgi:hypothetical protein
MLKAKWDDTLEDNKKVVTPLEHYILPNEIFSLKVWRVKTTNNVLKINHVSKIIL